MNVAENPQAFSPEIPLVTGNREQLDRVPATNLFLFDLDDTIARYNPNYIQALLVDTLGDYTTDAPRETLKGYAGAIFQSMHYGHAQKTILEACIGSNNITDYWMNYGNRFTESFEPAVVMFDPQILKLLSFLQRNNYHYGVISNAKEDAGSKVIKYLNDTVGFNVCKNALFLGDTELKKPSPSALTAYEEATKTKVDTSVTAYIGNAVSDLTFAYGTDLLPIAVDYDNLFRSTDFCDTHRGIVDHSIVTQNVSHIKNMIETQRPNYRRQISFLVSKAGIVGKPDLDPSHISVANTEENLYEITNDATAKITDEIPKIFSRFHTMLSEQQSDLSLCDITDYRSYIHDATGAVRIPNPEYITDPSIRLYFSQPGRTRTEGNFVFGRGALYYRHMMSNLKDNFEAQTDTVQQEVSDAIKALQNSTKPHTLEEYMPRLAVTDNLRGNMMSILLSVINYIRDNDDFDIDKKLQLLYRDASELYSESVALQYANMLGLEHNEQISLAGLENIDNFMASYRSYFTSQDTKPKFKVPESDNQLLIAARAHELLRQYPEAEVYVGVSSGGVELATAAVFLSKILCPEKDMECIYFPVSVHQGTHMWEHDKAEKYFNDHQLSFFSIEKTEGRHAVICEDNSNSGQTIERVHRLLAARGATKVNFAVVEIDPTRMTLHAVQQKAGAKHYIGNSASRKRPLANYAHPDFMGAVDIVRILPSDAAFAKVIAMDTANRG